LKRLVLRIRDADRALFRTIFRVKWTPLTPIMRAFHRCGEGRSAVGRVRFLAYLATGFETYNLLVPWTAVAVSWVIAEGAKFLFNRARPFIRDTEIAPLIKTPSSSSFPSGHSATAGAGAITLSVIYPTFAPALILSGFLVALSRIYLGVHYPFDVLAGVLIGTATAAVVLVLA
jgi:undecaprenyl-diphosphatase